MLASSPPSSFFFSSRRRHTSSLRDWSSDVCSSDLRRGLGHREPGERSGRVGLDRRLEPGDPGRLQPDRKSTRLNSSHVEISYAVFCLKKKSTSATALSPICNDRSFHQGRPSRTP